MASASDHVASDFLSLVFRLGFTIFFTFFILLVFLFCCELQAFPVFFFLCVCVCVRFFYFVIVAFIVVISLYLCIPSFVGALFSNSHTIVFTPFSFSFSPSLLLSLLLFVIIIIYISSIFIFLFLLFPIRIRTFTLCYTDVLYRN